MTPYPYTFDERVLRIDLIRLKHFFPDPDSFAQMKNRLQEAIDLVCRDPKAGTELSARLSGWRKLPWESGPVRNWDPWPDMRLIYRLQNGTIKIFAVDKRCPGDSNDVYSLAEQRRLTPE